MKEKTKKISYDIGLSSTDRQAVCNLLKPLLADEFVLYMHALNCHWNVVGPHFGPLHKLFLDNYEMLLEIADAIAERIRTFGGTAPATLMEYAQLTQLREKPAQVKHGAELIEDLYNNHLLVIRLLRTTIVACQDEYHDLGTGNFLTDLMEKHEKAAWMLRAHLE